MENKKDKKVLLLVILALIILALGGFVVYDKLIKKETCDCPKTECICEKCECPEKECQCEKCEEKTNNCPQVTCNCKENDDASYYTNLLDNVKYQNLSRPDNYIIFNTKDKTWKATRNNCHGYDDVSGKYSIEKGKIILTGDTFESGKNEFSIISGNYNEEILLIYDNNQGIQGCSEQEYFVAENLK